MKVGILPRLLFRSGSAYVAITPLTWETGEGAYWERFFLNATASQVSSQTCLALHRSTTAMLASMALPRAGGVRPSAFSAMNVRHGPIEPSPYARNVDKSYAGHLILPVVA